MHMTIEEEILAVAAQRRRAEARAHLLRSKEQRLIDQLVWSRRPPAPFSKFIRRAVKNRKLWKKMKLLGQPVVEEDMKQQFIVAWRVAILIAVALFTTLMVLTC